MSFDEVRKHLTEMRMELTRHLRAAVDAHDDDGAHELIDARRLLKAESDRLLLAQLTASLADVQTCVAALAASTKDLAALEAKSDQIAKVVGIVNSALGLVSKVAAKALGG